MNCTLAFIAMTISFFVSNQQPSTYVDDKGYRAINYLGKDHKQAIDKDVYHMARLGLNGFRVHIWDAEVTSTNSRKAQVSRSKHRQPNAKIKERARRYLFCLCLCY